MSDFAVSRTRQGSGFFPGRGGTRLFYRWNLPNAPIGQVILVHGATEHSGRYRWLERALVEARFAFFGFDQRGLGRSAGRRGDVVRFDDYIHDLSTFVDLVSNHPTKTALFIYGHSMGSLVAARYVAMEAGRCQGVILGSTPAQLVRPPARPIQEAAQLFVKLFPWLRLNPGIEPLDLSTNPEIVEQARQDPLIQRRVTLRWSLELIRAIETLPETLKRISIPVLVLHGTDDRIASLEDATAMMPVIRSTDKSIITFPHLRHELHNEIEEGRNEVFRDVVNWLTSRVETSSSVGDRYASQD